jgi:multidrug resistance efflux pump
MVKQRALFRDQAVNAYLLAMRDGAVLRVDPPWARRFLALASLTIMALVAGSFFVKVDQTGRGRGVLRVAGGTQALASQTNGVVLELKAHSGDVVPAGAVLAKIDSTAMQMALLEAERQIERAEENLKIFTTQRDKEQAQRVKLLQQRAGLLARRAQNQRMTVDRLKQRASTFDKLAKEGLASGLDRGTAENDLAAGQRGVIELEEEITTTQLQISNIEADMATELEKRRAEVKKAADKRDTLALQLQQTEIRAPRAGKIEALVVKVGDPVTVGMTVARLIPEGAPREIVVFVPEADRAFLQEGSDVRIELDQLPAGEFGGLHARVVRIGGDLATGAELQEVLSSETKLEGPSYRVELSLNDSDAVRRIDKLLRPGSLVTARFVLRRRRLASILFEPLRRYVD